MSQKTWHLGLTGGIGSGKSTVAAMLAQRGAEIIDADAIARDLMEPGTEVFEEVVQAFGHVVLDNSGALDRAALARVVFSDESARERLNGIVHPAVRAESRKRVDAAEEDPDSLVIVQDIPLLVETGQSDSFDGVIVVEAPEAARVERLVTTRGMDPDDARSRIRAQATDEQRRAISTWVIDNSGSEEETEEQVDRLWRELVDQNGGSGR
ncbi:dephospho-CoA kinase [uncultured Kocuria sp.]|uniref:dephospho-CoA kinase n=1 Tax=uncultured Kocuria sp. TaxID=259305 RepID=UPI00259A676A|nr:dephospho-CoA kinase [uncultured Kocuria sp.]